MGEHLCVWLILRGIIFIFQLTQKSEHGLKVADSTELCSDSAVAIILSLT